MSLLAHEVLAIELVAARKGSLERLVKRVNETVNVGALTADHVVYHDRVEASWPLGLHFEAGSKVPVHCTSMANSCSR